MNMIDVVKNLATDEQCLDFLERKRWPDGKVRCIRCGSDKISRIQRKAPSKNKRTRLYSCLEGSCKHQFSPTTDTLFHDSHLPLHKWFAAVALIVHAKKGMSAKQIERHLGVNYRTAWYMGHRIRKAMAQPGGITVKPMEVSNRPKLSGIVEVDETYVGGKQRGSKNRFKNKEVVMGIRERGGELRLKHITNNGVEDLGQQIKENISHDAKMVITDEWIAYPRAMLSAGINGSKHETIRHKDKIYVRGEIYTNTVESAFSLFKRGIVGSFHSVSGKHLHRYLSEFEYRFNGRKESDLFGSTLAHMVSTKEMKYAELTAE
jgi:transposase-like protein